MAFVKDIPTEEEEKKLSTQGSLDSGVTGVGNAPQSTSTSTAAGSEPLPGARNSSGGWTNISSYLNANKPQAAQLGANVANIIDKETNEANSAINNAENTFNTNVNQNRLNYDQNAVQDTLNTGNASDQVKRQLSGTYAGPKTWDDAALNDTVNKEIQDATTRASLTGDVGGRTELLRETSTNPQTTGNLKLNQLFLQSNTDAAKALQDAAARTNPLTANQTDAQARNAAAAQAAADEAAGIQTRTRNDITSYLGQAEAARQSALAQEQARITREQEAARTYLAQLAQIPQEGDINGLIDTLGGSGREQQQSMMRSASALPPGWQSAGLSREQAVDLANKIREARALGVEPPSIADYYTAQDASGLTTANVTTPEEAARISALNQLVGLGGIQSAQGFGSTGNFNITGANADLAARIQSQLAQNEAKAANDRTLAAQQEANQKMADAQNSAISQQKKVGTVLSAASGAAAGAMVAGPIGAVVGGVIGAVVCFEENTPVTMADGTLKTIKHINIGDKLLLGGNVTGVGRYLADQLVNYRGCLVTPTHVVYHEVANGRYIWTTAGKVGVTVDLITPAIVCPLMTETHLMVTSDFVSADVITIPPEVDPDWHMNHDDRIDYLNNWDERNAQIDQLIQLRKEKVEEILCSM